LALPVQLLGSLEIDDAAILVPPFGNKQEEVGSVLEQAATLLEL
jgi:hypothetical protein